MIATSQEAPGGDESLRTSAEGWHRVQLAVIGFIGLCGVLTSADSRLPVWLQVAAGVLVLVALALACAATWLIASVAWPLRRGRPRDGDAARDRRRLAGGIALTFTSVAVLALGTASAWWPVSEERAGLVSVTVADGRSVCGTLEAGRARALALETGGGSIEIPLSAVTAVRPAPGCE